MHYNYLHDFLKANIIRLNPKPAKEAVTMPETERLLRMKKQCCELVEKSMRVSRGWTGRTA